MRIMRVRCQIGCACGSFLGWARVAWSVSSAMPLFEDGSPVYLTSFVPKSSRKLVTGVASPPTSRAPCAQCPRCSASSPRRRTPRLPDLRRRSYRTPWRGSGGRPRESSANGRLAQSTRAARSVPGRGVHRSSGRPLARSPCCLATTGPARARGQEATH